MKARMTALLIATLVCVMALLPTMAKAVSNVSQLTTNPATGQIYFGNDAKTSSAPALYRYVANDATQTTAATTITLFYDGINIAQNYMQYDSSEHHLWGGSTICAWLNGNNFLNNTSVFTTAEKAAMKTQYSTIQESGYNSWDTFTPSQTIVLSSVAEVIDGGTWSMNQEARKKGTQWWWLRSPGDVDSDAAIVGSGGSVFSLGGSAGGRVGVRPALKLNLSSVLFTSAAAGGKSSTAGATLGGVAAPSGNQKLTILDTTNLNAGTVTAYGENTNAGTTIKVSTTGATAGKSLSASL